MNYKELFINENTDVAERYRLAMDRIALIPHDNMVDEKYTDYFIKMADYIIMIDELVDNLNDGIFENLSFEQLKDENIKLYDDILGDNYLKSYANPRVCFEKTGDKYYKYLCYLYFELRKMISFAFEFRLSDITLYAELFIQIYVLFEYDNEPDVDEIKNIIYWFNSDNSDIFMEYRIREQFDVKLSFARDIIMDSDLYDLRYLYKYGEYISDNEIETARYINSLSDEMVKTMADTMSEGYRIGFVVGNKDLSKKKIAVVQYAIGFERVIRQVIRNFEKLGLKTVIYRAGNTGAGYYSTSPNKQYNFDHKDDAAIYFDKQFMERKLGVLQTSYEKYKKEAYVYAGPAVLETFGETPFDYEIKKEAISYDEKQKLLQVEYANKAKIIVNNYVKMEERSFTIIAFPTYEIGNNFNEIFEDTIKLNTLDYNLYQRIQQTIIGVLDQAEYVEIKGMNGNITDLRVNLCDISDSSNETKFENCVADVNIPVGEVFTSPKLSGTDGVLNVSKVFLNGLVYKNIKITFKNGMITDYICDNFDSEDDNKKYIRDNVLYNHDTLPMGEFAIGTNTTAYMMAKKYDRAEKLPILIAEKMGPHFAVGDTCYSYSEDVKVYNPDKKEIMCRDNEITLANRKNNPQKAYFNCHTDITIPYDELGSIRAVKSNGERITIIENGRFVLKGTEELNLPFDK